MKKLLCSIILLPILLCACSTTPEPTPSSEHILYGSHTTCTNLETYNDFISTCEQLPSTFVEYSEIAHLGAFNRFMWLNNFPEYAHLIHYTYNLTDSNNHEYTLRISHFLEDKDSRDSLNRISISSEMVDMTTAGPNGENGCIDRCGLHYVYNRGRLVSITLYTDNMAYYFDLAETDIREYPLDGETTLLSRLLSMDDAVVRSAVSEFLEYVPQ